MLLWNTLSPFHSLHYVSDVHGSDVDGIGSHSLVNSLPSLRCDAYQQDLNRLFGCVRAPLAPRRQKLKYRV